MKRQLVILFFLLNALIVFGQRFGQSADAATKYAPEKVINPTYGIIMYEKMNPQIGGDSSRSTNKGYASQGWEEDYYISGALLHKGYYEDGQLRTYKNYYENGNVERSFKVIDFKRCSMEIFYSDGKPKSIIIYYNGNLMKATDYYPNGQIEYEIENEKNLDYIVYRRSYSEDGKPQEIFELTNEKKKLFYQKEYHDNGNIKTEGMLKFNPYKMDYMKDGSWKVYDENGKFARTEKFAYGERLNE
jgi:antitoxin component YwqK of YwqJK toxin-antitoxin module